MLRRGREKKIAGIETSIFHVGERKRREGEGRVPVDEFPGISVEASGGEKGPVADVIARTLKKRRGKGGFRTSSSATLTAVIVGGRGRGKRSDQCSEIVLGHWEGRGERVILVKRSDYLILGKRGERAVTITKGGGGKRKIRTSLLLLKEKGEVGCRRGVLLGGKGERRSLLTE